MKNILIPIILPISEKVPADALVLNNIHIEKPILFKLLQQYPGAIPLLMTNCSSAYKSIGESGSKFINLD